MNFTLTKLAARFLIACLTVVVSLEAHAAAGRVQYVNGNVVISARAHPPRAAQKGDEVNVGDIVTTAANATIQIVMVDGSILSLRPDTRMVIESYLTGEDQSVGQKVLSLFRGGLRAITGHIKQLSGDNYAIRTPSATIGIRGTDHEVFHIPPPRPGEQALGKPGSYDRVYQGGTFIQTQGGTLNIEPNQVGYVADNRATPVLLDTIPAFLSFRPAPLPVRRQAQNGQGQARQPGQPTPGQPGAAGKPAAPEGSTAPGPGSGAPPPPGQNAPPPGPGGLPPIAPGMPPMGTFVPTIGAMAVSEFGDAHPAAPNSAMVGGDIFPVVGANGTFYLSGSGGMVINDLLNNHALLDPANNMVAVSDGKGFRYSRYDAPLIAPGSAIVDGIPVNWGIYQGGLKFDPMSGEVKPLLFHFTYAPLATPPVVMQTIGGVHAFGTIAGFNTPVAENGLVGGTVSSFSATINFASLQLTNWNIALTDANSRSWNGAYTGTLSLNPAGAFSAPLTSAGCTGAGCAGSTTGTGNFSAIVVGPNGGGIISSYDIQSGSAAVGGSVVAK